MAKSFGKIPIIKILDQLNNPRKEVIQLLSQEQSKNQSSRAHLLKREDNGNLTVFGQPKNGSNSTLTESQLLHQIWQLLGSLAINPIGVQSTHNTIGAQNNLKKVNYLKQVLESKRRVYLHSHKLF